MKLINQINLKTNMGALSMAILFRNVDIANMLI